MAHSLSAKKRVRQNIKKRLVNRSRKSEVKTQLKHLEDAVGAGDMDAAKKQFKLASRDLDKIASSGTMHKNTAARKKSRLAKRLNSIAAQKAAK